MTSMNLEVKHVASRQILLDGALRQVERAVTAVTQRGDDLVAVRRPGLKPPDTM
jgi:hypothetical protein